VNHVEAPRDAPPRRPRAPIGVNRVVSPVVAKVRKAGSTEGDKRLARAPNARVRGVKDEAQRKAEHRRHHESPTIAGLLVMKPVHQEGSTSRFAWLFRAAVEGEAMRQILGEREGDRARTEEQQGLPGALCTHDAARSPNGRPAEVGEWKQWMRPSEEVLDEPAGVRADSPVPQRSRRPSGSSIPFRERLLELFR